MAPLPFLLPMLSRGYAELDSGARAAGLRAAELAAAALSSALQQEVRIAGRPVPGPASPRAGSARLAFDLPALPGAALLDVDAALVAQMVDRLAGGQGEPGLAWALTPIEKAAFELFGLVAVHGLRRDAAFEERLAPRLSRGELGLAGALAVELEIEAGGSRGTGRLLLPPEAVRAFRERRELSEPIAAAAVTGSFRRGGSALQEEELAALGLGDVLLVDGNDETLVLPGGPRLRGRSEQGLFLVEETSMTETAANFPVMLELELARVPISLADLARLEPGAALPLALHRSGEVTLRVGDKVIARGELVEIDGAVGVRILSLEK